MNQAVRRNRGMVEVQAVGKRKEGAGSRRLVLPEVLRSRNVRLRLIGGADLRTGRPVLPDRLALAGAATDGQRLRHGHRAGAGGRAAGAADAVGGAFTDRFSPRAVMLYSNYLRAAVVGLMAVLVLTGSVQSLDALRAGADLRHRRRLLLPGDAGHPAPDRGQGATPGRQRPQSGDHADRHVPGAGLAGHLDRSLDGGGQAAGSAAMVPDRLGIGIAFSIDALSFFASALTLRMMTIGGDGARTAAAEASVTSAIREGLAAVWNDLTLRIFFIVIAAINLFVSGPISVGIPMLANSAPAGRGGGFRHHHVRLWWWHAAGHRARGRAAETGAPANELATARRGRRDGSLPGDLGLHLVDGARRARQRRHWRGQRLHDDPVHYLAAKSHRPGDARPHDEPPDVRLGGRIPGLERGSRGIARSEPDSAVRGCRRPHRRRRARGRSESSSAGGGGRHGGGCRATGGRLPYPRPSPFYW